MTIACPKRTTGTTLLILAATALFTCTLAKAQDPALPDRAQVRGELEILFVDGEAGHPSAVRYFVRDRNSARRVELHFDDPVPVSLRAGQSVEVRGRSEGDDLYAAALISGSDAASATTTATAPTATSGEQHTLVLAANFPGIALPCTLDQVRDLVFTDPDGRSVDDYYRDTSHGNLWLTGEARGPYNIAAPNDCSAPFSSYTDPLDAAARANGVNVDAYVRRIYVLPNTGCGYAGMGTVGATPSQALIFQCGIQDVYAHELGHNFGMYHASSPNSEYGDRTDVMGLSNVGLRHLNGAHQDEMGWRSAAMNRLVTGTGTYDIAPLAFSESEAVAPQILRIPKADTGETWFLSYRRQVGFDSSLAWWHNNIVTVHRYTDGGGAPTNTWLVDELAAGETFTDSANDLSITHLGRTDTYATVEVSFKGSTPACTTAAPTLSVSPGSQEGAPGERRTYGLTITNHDSSACAASTFTLSSAVPAGWAASLSTMSLTLVPGAAGAATLYVTAPAAAEAGSHGLSVALADAATPAHAASAGATFVVADACVAASPSVSVSPGSQSGDAGDTLRYSVTLTNRDDTACSASRFEITAALPAGWAGGLATPSFTLSPGVSAGTSLDVTSAPSAAAGDYTLSLVAADTALASHAGSANARYAVNPTAGSTDTEPPTPPSGLTASANHRQVALTWNAGSDNVGVVGYSVYRDGRHLATVTTTGHTDTTGADGTAYVYTVAAFDAAGNRSLESVPVSAGKTRKGGKDSGGGGKGKGPNQ